MKKDKKLSKISRRLVKGCFDSGKLNQNKVLRVLAIFKKMPINQAIQALTIFKRDLSREIKGKTLLIESTEILSKEVVFKIANKLESEYQFSKVETDINPDLIGGIKVKIGDTLIDASTKNSINQIKEAWLN